MDTVFLMTVAAAGLIGWILCRGNTKVARVWKWISIPAVVWLGVYLVFTLSGARMEWWSFAQMDRPTLVLALLPILAWPIRKHELRSNTTMAAG